MTSPGSTRNEADIRTDGKVWYRGTLLLQLGGFHGFSGYPEKLEGLEKFVFAARLAVNCTAYETVNDDCIDRDISTAGLIARLIHASFRYLPTGYGVSAFLRRKRNVETGFESLGNLQRDAPESGKPLPRWPVNANDGKERLIRPIRSTEKWSVHVKEGYPGYQAGKVPANRTRLNGFAGIETRDEAEGLAELLGQRGGISLRSTGKLRIEQATAGFFHVGRWAHLTSRLEILRAAPRMIYGWDASAIGYAC
ncbi:hypothetical protein WN48_05922 [Eufriesea mexicana]|nr:hypothetical protein WN48_05922 [Eufriesea mexicana]